MTKKMSAKHVEIVAFSSSRATLRATRSDRPEPAQEICRHWSWAIFFRGTKSCPTRRKRFYFDMFHSTNRGGMDQNEVRRRREKRGSGGRGKGQDTDSQKQNPKF